MGSGEALGNHDIKFSEVSLTYISALLIGHINALLIFTSETYQDKA